MPACDRCGRAFATRAALAAHGRRKVPCGPAPVPAPAAPADAEAAPVEFVAAATELATLAGLNRYRAADRDWWEAYAAVAARSPDVRGGFAAALASTLAAAGDALAGAMVYDDDPELAAALAASLADSLADSLAGAPAEAPPERGSAADDAAVRAEAARLEAAPGFGAYVAALRREVAAESAAATAAERAEPDAALAAPAAPSGVAATAAPAAPSGVAATAEPAASSEPAASAAPSEPAEAARRVSPDLFAGLGAPEASPAAFFAAARAADPRAAGLAVESAHVAAGALRENNRRCYRAAAAAAPGARLTLIAYVDGVGPGGEVSELKTRRGRLFAHLPAYERCQLGAIALTTGCPAVRLRQVLVGDARGGPPTCSYARADAAALYGDGDGGGDGGSSGPDDAANPPQRLDVFGGEELRAGVAAPAAEALRRLAARAPGAGLAAGLASLPRADLEHVAARFAERVARMGGRR